MNKGLEALKELDKQVFAVNNTEKYHEMLNIIETTLKALEIIERKQVDIATFRVVKYQGMFGVSDYNRYTKNRYDVRDCYFEENHYLTKEEYDLLKEVLK